MNKKFDFRTTTLNDALLIQSFVSFDERGSFIKDFSSQLFLQNHLEFEVKESFYTCSKKGVLRAIHFQVVKEQAKIIRCVSGKIYDVIIDLRPSSSTYLKWEAFVLSGDNHLELYVPKGFGHGYLVLEDSIVSYKCNEVFFSEYDDGIIWNDSKLNINWPTHMIKELILSDKDKNLQTFDEFKLKGMIK